MANRKSLGTNPKRNSMGPHISSNITTSNVNKVEIPVTELLCEHNNTDKVRRHSSGIISSSTSNQFNKLTASSNRKSLPSKVNTLEIRTSNETTKKLSGANTTKNFILSNKYSISSNNVKRPNIREVLASNNFPNKRSSNACNIIKPSKAKNVENSNNTKEVANNGTVNKCTSATNVQKILIGSKIPSNISSKLKTSTNNNGASKLNNITNTTVSKKPCVPSDNNIKPPEINLVELRESTNNTIWTSNKTVEFVCKEIGPNIIKMVKKITTRDTYGRTALHVLCGGTGFEKLMKFKTEFGPINVGRGQLETLRDVIESGADINAVDCSNNTPLHEAVAAGREEYAELLLQSGALLNVRDNDYDTPLHRACQLNKFPMVTLLVKYGADINATNSLGESVMNINSTRIQQLLQQTNSKINILPVFYIERSRNVFISEVRQKTKEFLVSKHFKCLPLSRQDGAFCVIGDNQKLNHVEVLLAILKGIMVLRESDLKIYLSKDEVIQPNLIPEEIRPPVLKSIKNCLNRHPKLFDRLNFYILRHSSSIINFRGVDFSVSHLSHLIKEGGGQTLIRAPTEKNTLPHRPFHMPYSFNSDSNFIVYDKRDPPLKWNDKKLVRHVSSEWVLDCASNFFIPN